MKHLFDENDYGGLNRNTPNFNKLSDFGFTLQHWIESLQLCEVLAVQRETRS